MVESKVIIGRVVRGISIPAMVIPAVGLFALFFSVLHLHQSERRFASIRFNRTFESLVYSTKVAA